MNSGGSALSGNAKAALFLASLDGAAARALLRNLPASSAATLQRELEEIDAAPPGTGAQMLADLNDFVVSEAVSEREVATEERSATPASVAGDIGASPFHLSGVEELARILQSEHPQTVACILSRLDTERAGAIFSNLPAEQASEVVRRMAEIGPVSPQSASRMAAALERKLAASDRGDDASDTVRAAAEILRSVAPSTRNEITTAINRDHPGLAARLRDIGSPASSSRRPQDRAAGHGGAADDR